jgi:hypothetical protein
MKRPPVRLSIAQSILGDKICIPKDFALFFLLAKVQFLGFLMSIDSDVVELLADRAPTKARGLMLAWEEARNASWANAARESESRAASRGHLSQLRGQFRFHLGEAALVEASRTAGIGSLPFQTIPVGGTFIISRVGRFGLVSLVTHRPRIMPRKSITRKMLSLPNKPLDPQRALFEIEATKKVITELAYFGCLLAIPNTRDHSVPAQLALAVPNAALTQWLSWIPLPRLHALLQDKVDSASDRPPEVGTVPDQAFPRLRLPPNEKIQEIPANS